MTASLKDGLRAAIPLPARMRVAAWLARQRWLPVRDHVAVGLVRDLLVKDPKQFHKFLWANHFMGYARWYDSEQELFEFEQMQPTRVELFRDLLSVLDEQRIPHWDVRSFLEVGCSLGYLLRYLEVKVLPDCRDIVGIDIDAPAIQRGQEFLAKAGSRVSLYAGDMEALDTMVGARTFDVTMAAGVLSYLNEDDAGRMVAQLLGRTRHVLVLAGLASHDRNNTSLTRSELSPDHEGQWVHNFEALVARAGGRILRSRWEGATQYNRQTICFGFAAPGPAGRIQ